MIKMLAPALRHPANRDLAAFQRYWRESHGPLFVNTRRLRRYVQHLTLPELYDDDQIRCSYDGCSMFWYDSLDDLRLLSAEPHDAQLWEAAMADDRQLFDRSASWPTRDRFAMIIADEVVVRDQPAEPGMIKAIWTMSRRPGITPAHCFEHWRGPLADIVLDVPGLGRYVQNHSIPEAHTVRGLTHDGWSEMWFPDLESFRSVLRSSQWQRVLVEWAALFAEPIGLCVATEWIQKELGEQPRTWTDGLTETDIEQRLIDHGYSAPVRVHLAGRLQRGDQHGLVAVWTDEHLVVLGDPTIDLRPEPT